MYDKAKGLLYFPHLVPGATLGGKEHVYNDIHGGMKRVEDFKNHKGENYKKNSFFGGRVDNLGFIKDYGFYACIDSMSPKKSIIGFYVDDGTIVTKKGQALLKKRFPSAEILWDGVPPEEPTPDDTARRQALIEEAREYGHSPQTLTRMPIEELQGLVQAWKSGKAEEAKGTVVASDGVAKAQHDGEPVALKKMRGAPRELA